MKTPNLFLSFFQEGDKRMMKKEIICFTIRTLNLHSIDMTQDQSNPLKCTRRTSFVLPGTGFEWFSYLQ